MFKKALFVDIIFILFIFLILSGCGGKKQTLLTFHERQYGNETVAEAHRLLNLGKADDAIKLLTDYCSDNPENFKSKVLLSEAYFEKCSQLKENGDEQYRTLIHIPFRMSKEIITKNRYDNDKLAEGLYICAKSYLINNRANKARRYINKALALSSFPCIDYYFVQADSYAERSRNELRHDRKGSSRSDNVSRKHGSPGSYRDATVAYNNIIDIATNDRIKGLAYYKLGLHLKAGSERKEARNAFESALMFAEEDSLKNKILKNLDEKKGSSMPLTLKEN